MSPLGLRVPPALGSALLRLSGLAGRMALVLYIARMLGLNAMANYGFFVGAAAVITVVTGFGLDQPSSRIYARASNAVMAQRLRDRLAMRAIVATLLVAAGMALLAWIAPHSALRSGWAAMILIGEPLAYEMQQALVARHHPVAGNLLIALRLAAWVPLPVLLGLAVPALRSLDLVFMAWGIAQWLTLAGFALRFGRWRAQSASPPLAFPDWRWIGKAFTEQPLIYLSELAAAGSIYSDRYIVAALAGLRAAGGYTFAWSFINAVVPIVQAGIFNHLTPDLLRGWNEHDLGQWRAVFRRARQHTFWLAVMLGAALLGLLGLVLPLAGMVVPGLPPFLLLTMVAGTVVRLEADVLKYALVSTGRDRRWAMVDIVALGVTPLIGIAAILALGAIGAGVQMLLGAALVFGLRRKLLHAILREAERGETIDKD